MTNPTGRQDLADAEATAEGKVRVAELKLGEVRDKESAASVIAAAEEQLAAAVRRLQRCRDAIVDADYAERLPPPEPEPEPEVEPEPADRPMQYECASDWVEQYLVPQWRRPPVDLRWCRRWWLHGEAMSRLEALWRSWEHLRYEGPLGMAIWWRDYADYHLRELTARGGPFDSCESASGTHQLLPTLRVDPAPRELRRPLPAADHHDA